MEISEIDPILLDQASRLGLHISSHDPMIENRITINQQTIHYIDWGNPQKPTILFLHGWGQTGHIWDFLSLSLRDRYHCVALDLRGHGDSSWAINGDYSIQAHIRDLTGMFRIFGRKPMILIGLSLGARTSYVFAAQYPNLVERLIIVDSGPETSETSISGIRSFMELPAELDTFDEFVERVHQYNHLRPIDQVQASLKHNLMRLANGKWTWKYDPVLRSGNPPEMGISEEFLWQSLKRIQCPTLVVRGQNSDILTHKTAMRMLSSIPNASLTAIEKAGHRVPGDNPLSFETAIHKFLTTNGYLGSATKHPNH